MGGMDGIDQAKDRVQKLVEGHCECGSVEFWEVLECLHNCSSLLR
jgi:hypothetical protein